MSNLVSTEWLAEQGSNDNLCVLDCSWQLPSAKRNVRADYETAHIAGAHFFDLDAISNTNSALPHMLPSPEKFGLEVTKLGASNNKKIICYDSTGLFSAARAWWMFKIFGHDNVAVLDGGLKKWLAEARPVHSGFEPALIGNFKANFRPDMVKSKDQVAVGSAQIADARSPARFRGEEAEPRPGVSPGHIPGAKNVHYVTLVNADGTLKPPKELAQIFSTAGIDLEKPITTSCGSGVTAAILTLALTQLGAKHHALYDGSWADWGSSGNDIELG